MGIQTASPHVTDTSLFPAYIPYVEEGQFFFNEVDQAQQCWSSGTKAYLL